MTHQEKINFITKKAHEANPSILDLVFGCKVQYNKDFPQIIVAPANKFNEIISIYTKNDEMSYIEDINEFQILGREIRLADVLLAMQKFHGAIECYCQFDGTLLIQSFGDNKTSSRWNLSKDSLTDQSPETVDFIYKTLGGEYEND